MPNGACLTNRGTAAGGYVRGAPAPAKVLLTGCHLPADWRRLDAGRRASGRLSDPQRAVSAARYNGGTLAPVASGRFARFGPFQLDLGTGELRKRDRRLKLQNQSFQILALLLEGRGELVTRDEIRAKVWSSDTVVEFEHSIATAVKKLRQVLGDDADRPRYVETLPRRGYRWLGPVSWDERVPTSPPLLTPPSPILPATLVGRDEPLSTLRERLRRALHGERQIVWISGEPGIGKTALVEEFLSQHSAEVPHHRVARGQCIEWQGGAEPYYPVLEALGELLRTDARDSLTAELALRAPTWLAQFPALLTPDRRATLDREILGMTRERMLREICDLLDTLASAQPLVIVFEDLHWADPSTIDVISAVARRRASSQLMIIGTGRCVGADHPLHRLRQDLLAHKLSHEIALEPLTEPDIIRYVSGASAATPSVEAVARLIYRHSGGNPLFMVAVWDDMVRRGAIAREGTTVRLRAELEDLDLGVPPTLTRMIEAQVDGLSAEERAALEVGSVVGVGFSTWLIAAAMSADPEAVERLCDGIARRKGLLRATAERDSGGHASPGYQFKHALYRDVLYGSQSPHRRVQWHLRIGEELERVVGPGKISDGMDVFGVRPEERCGSRVLAEAAPDLARHFEAAADWSRAANYLGIMADTAGRRCASHDAIALWERALDLVTRLPDADAARTGVEVEILQRLAASYVVSNDARAVATYERLVSRSARYGMLAEEISGLIGMAYPSSWVDSRRCLLALERALALSESLSDPLARARVRASCFVRRMWVAGWNASDAAACQNALAEIRLTGERRVVAAHILDSNFVQWVSSEYRVACEEAVENRAILLGGSDENPHLNLAYANSQLVLPWSLLFLGDWGEMLRELAAGVELATKNADDYCSQTLRLYQAWLHLHAMDFAEVVAICESIVPISVLPERRPWRRLALALAGSAEVALGNRRRALEHLSSARHEMDRQTVIFDWYTRMLIESALTDLWLAQGDIDRAQRHARQFLDAALSTAERTWQALAWEANARVASALDDLARAEECIAKALATMKGFEVPLAAWRVHATAADVFESLLDPASAERHRALSRATIFQLASSLPAETPLRETFLSAPLVARVIASGGSSVSPRRSASRDGGRVQRPHDDDHPSFPGRLMEGGETAGKRGT